MLLRRVAQNDRVACLGAFLTNIAEPLAHHARARAGHPAIISGERVIYYRDLDSMVRRTASHLMSFGLVQGDVVGVALRDSVEHLVILFALARAGMVMLPLDWRWTAVEQQRIVAHFNAKLVLVEPVAEPLQRVPCTIVNESWYAAVDVCSGLGEFPRGDGPLLMSLSSGTTGRPKGPRLSHSQFLRRFWGHWINLGFNSEDRFMASTPFYYGGGRTFAMLMLYSGGTVVLFPPPYEPEQLCAAIAEHQASAIFLVPTLLRRLLTLSDELLTPMRSMRLVLSSGAALHPDERRQMRGRICPGFVEYYSSTEGGGVSYLTSHDPERYDRSVGRPVFAVDVQCVDEEHEPLPPGEIGRIRYRGPAVADGFWNDPEASNEAFRDGWFYPGDLGSMDLDGYLYLKGRAKDMIIRGGINIYPAEIEALLQSHPAVHECAVVGWPSREFNEEVAAFVMLNREVAPAELQELCRAQLARYKIPREIFIIDGFPRNALGKVVKASLAAKLPPL